ncbi:MAG: hypothetical protein WCP32_11890 [Bacteroidota bacterium]
MMAFDKRILQFEGGEIELLDNSIAKGTIISNPSDERVIYVDEPLDLYLIGKEFQRIALLKDPSINPFNHAT